MRILCDTQEEYNILKNKKSINGLEEITVYSLEDSMGAILWSKRDLEEFTSKLSLEDAKEVYKLARGQMIRECWTVLETVVDDYLRENIR